MTGCVERSVLEQMLVLHVLSPPWLGVKRGVLALALTCTAAQLHACTYMPPYAHLFQ